MKINRIITPFNKWEGRRGDVVQWIVMHYTGNPCTYGADTAKGEARYFAEDYRGASAHFFVDENEIWQSVDLRDTAWHCGEGTSKNGCHNTNSIGVEMCVEFDGGAYLIPDKTEDLAVELVRYLLSVYPSAQVCRHFDVTGKICPEPWVSSPWKWKRFLRRLKNGMSEEEKKEFEDLKSRVRSLEQIAAAGEDCDRVLIREIAGIAARTGVRWEKAEDAPEWLRPTAEKCVRKGFLKGEDGKLRLTEDLARALVICDRAGVFGE